MSKAFFKKNMIVDTPFRYQVSDENGANPSFKKIEFKPANITQVGDKVNAEDINGIQENSIYEVEAVRVVEGVNEFYDIAIAGINDFTLFNAKLLIKFNETNTKVNTQLRILWNDSNKVYPIRFLNDFSDIQVNIGDLKKEYLGYINQVSNKFLLWDLYSANDKDLIFDTISKAQSASYLILGDVIQTLGLTTKGDGKGRYYEIKNSDDGSNLPYSTGLWFNKFSTEYLEKGGYQGTAQDLKEEIDSKGLENENSDNIFSIRGAVAPGIVITGDSLSYNHQDFDAVARQNAEDCKIGMNSWSFALRDAIIRDDENFKHSDEMYYTFNGENLKQNANTKFNTPFNGRLRVFRAKAQSNSLKFYVINNGETGNVYFWFLRNPTNTACSINSYVDGVLKDSNFNLLGDINKYQGYDLQFLEVQVPNDGLLHEVSFSNFIGTHGTPHATDRDLYFVGFGTKVFFINQTGRGSQSSKWLVDNLASKITNYNPDILIMSVGANDGWAGNPQGLQTPAQYKTNLISIINGVRAVKPNCRIILMAPPYTDESIVTNTTMQQYVDKAIEVKKEYNIEVIQMSKFFEKIPTSVYRFDSIHYTKQGNQLILEKMLEMFNIKTNSNLAKCSLSYGSKNDNKPLGISERDYFDWNGSSFAKTVLSESILMPVENLTKFSDSVLKLKFYLNTSLFSSIVLQQFDASTFEIRCSISDIYEDNYYFKLRKADGSLITATDWTNNPTAFKFIAQIN